MDETRIQTKTPDWIGREVRRFEDHRLLTGSGQYVDDIAPTGCLSLHFIRSAHACARIRRIDTTDAALSAGVVAIFTGRDVATLGDLLVNPIFPDILAPKGSIMPIDQVAAVGQPIAAVAADNLENARVAGERINIEFDPVQTPARTEIFRRRWSHGDTMAAFANAPHIVAVTLQHSRLTPAPIEPRAALANFDREVGDLTVWLSTQTPHRARSDLARILGFPIERIRVIAPDVGGTFGGKASIYPEDIMVSWAALRLGRPIKWCATRSEDFLSATHGRGCHSEGEMALTTEGQILALRVRLSFPLGYWLPYSATVPAWNASRILPGPYKVDAVDIESSGTMDNTAPLGIYRGAGRPEAAMLMERLVEKASRTLSIDPNQLRRRNLIKSHEFPYRTPTGETFDSGDYERLLDHSCEKAGYSELIEERDVRRSKGHICGVGTALYVEPCGQGWEGGSVKISPSGQIVAATGSTNQGQGRETAFAQILADALAIDPKDVIIQHGDTAQTPLGVGALASRSTAIGGSALLQAAETFRDKARALAAQLLQVPVDSVELDLGGFRHRNTKASSISWATIAEAACAEKSATDRNFALETSIVYHAKGEAWSSGCCIATVSIENDTGIPHIERIVCVDDAGVIINPLLARGQLFGGLAQGLGEALFERLVYDEKGELLTGSFSDYALPRAANMPTIILDKMETGSPFNELGAKGIGEAGCIGAPAAIVNAVLDALSPFGVGDIDMPLTGEKIWRAMKNGIPLSARAHEPARTPRVKNHTRRPRPR